MACKHIIGWEVGCAKAARAENGVFERRYRSRAPLWLGIADSTAFYEAETAIGVPP